eukprot:488957-Pleurochrysis_carterae.AAC.1
MASQDSARIFSGLQPLCGRVWAVHWSRRWREQAQKRCRGKKTEAAGERHGLERTTFPQMLDSDRGGCPESCDIEEDGGECAQRQLIRSQCARFGGIVRFEFFIAKFGVRNALSNDGWSREERGQLRPKGVEFSRHWSERFGDDRVSRMRDF